MYFSALTRSTLPRRDAHSDSAFRQICAYEVVLQVGIDFKYRDGPITQGVCNAACALFAIITARVRVVAVKRVDWLNLALAMRQLEMVCGTEWAAFTDRALATLLCQQSIL